MIERGHLDPLELDKFLLGRRGEIVDTYHVNTCRTCREALLDLALMAGIARGAPFPDPLEEPEGTPDADDDQVMASGSSPPVVQVYLQRVLVNESAVAGEPPPTVRFSRKASAPMHLSASEMDALLACAFAERAHDESFLLHLRHLKACDTCLGRFLQVSGRHMPSPQLVDGIVQALRVRPKSGPSED